MFLLLALVSYQAIAIQSSLSIESAELVASEDGDYLLDADFDLTLSPGLEEAVNKGVPLNFLVEFQLVSPRRYWFDDEIVSLTSKVSLSYHALSRQYLVNRDGHQLSFASIQEAKEEISRLRNWQVIDGSLLKKGEPYQAGLRMRLDQSKLPKALQVDTLSSEDWNMASERFRWTPALNP
ncbi:MULTISPECIES: DUF4390 domain-containing protein [Methylobacillus]|uniref:Putative proline rich signal peptide protein n=1 Tax=Methylobacillus flagellatus (strain ATCC 51484 / DSM 6875 / VKM B-1610 / KT) TaxID=265072 RepID=Q1H4Y3_METFK|nr:MULTISPECIES: DUF4390 domain-containing protein [Methylobacillus]ABE48454.1 putative proline rich signal peptide protein [Methylobacillus flagellatus KT]